MPVFVSRTTTLLGYALLFQLLGASPYRPGAAHAASPPSGSGSTTPTLGQALQPSTADQLGLVAHLRHVGAVFYGAWWCPACFKQKNLFGQEAGNQLGNGEQAAGGGANPGAPRGMEQLCESSTKALMLGRISWLFHGSPLH
jgi:hypothetical protein